MMFFMGLLPKSVIHFSNHRSGSDMVKSLVPLILALSVSLAVSRGSITGTVYDEQSGEQLVGVNVVIIGSSRGTTTDLNGKYTIANLDSGRYTLKISYVGYTSKNITDALLTDGEVLKLDVSLSSETIIGQEITVTAERVISTEAAALSERRKATTIGDGITMEQVKRTPDATSSDALKRITGISLVDNKFVFVRGITDRYNGTTLDGASVSSSEAGKKSFAFDLIPANLIQSTNVVKSATPDLPGDFTGGLVQLNTLDIPDRLVGKLSVGSSYNDRTTSREVLWSQGGSRDWLGFDDGIREYPGDNSNPTTLAQSMKNTWAPRSGRSPYNTSLSLAIGDQLTFDEENPSNGQLGFIGALSYRKSVQRNERTLNDRDQSRLTTGVRDDYSALWGGIVNVTYKFARLHKISFKNSYDRTGEDQAARYRMVDSTGSESDLRWDITQLRYSQRSLYNGHVVGEHLLPVLGDLIVTWRIGASSSARQDPDWKEGVFYGPLSDPAIPAIAGNSRRQWSHVNDRVFSAGMDFSLPVSDSKVKWGVLTEKGTTNYYIRGWKISPDQYPNPAPDSLTQLPLETVFSPENYGQGKFRFQEYTHPPDNYEGDQTLYAGYAMLDVPFEIIGNRFRFTGGARVENFEQNVIVRNTLETDGPGRRNQLKNIDILPSINLTYIVNDIANLRLAYSHSVNRPEIRERSKTITEDFVKNELVTGDTSLQRSYVHNYDVRFEVFPSPGEVLAISYFDKYISGAIEQELIFSGTRTRRPFNSGFSKNSGWELEMRKSFAFINEYLGNLFVNANYTRIMSQVEYPVTLGNSSNTSFALATRSMQGQSPYMINVSMSFTEPALGTSVNVSYNKAGRRLDTVGFQASDIYEEPRDIVDISLNQPIALGLEMKLTIKNLNGKDRVLTRDNVLYERWSTGTTYGFQLSYSM